MSPIHNSRFWESQVPLIQSPTVASDSETVSETEVWNFDPFELHAGLRKLCKDGETLKLSPQACDVLSVLVAKSGELVTREEIYQQLWPAGTHVEFQGNLNALIRDIRHALNDSARNPRFIQTVARRGYRFIAETANASAPAPSSSQARARPRPALRTFAWGIFPLLVLLALSIGLLLRTVGSALPVAQLGLPLMNYVGQMSSPAFSPDGKCIAFSWDGSGRQGLHIYVKRFDSGELRSLTHGEVEDRNASWSPDGKQIAFVRRMAPAQWAIFVIPSVGGVERQLALLSSKTRLSWSKNGQWIAYGVLHENGSNDTGIRAINLANGRTVHLTDGEPGQWGDISPSFSPDGRWLTFVRFFKLGVSELHIIPLQDATHPAGPPRRITFDMCDAEDPAWSPDSRSVIFTSDRQGNRKLWRISATEPSPTPQLIGGENAQTPSFDSRNRQVVYAHESRVDTLGRAAILGSDGRLGDFARLSWAPRLARNAAYSPDGKWVAYESQLSGPLQIWVSASDGSGERQLTSLNSSDIGTPRWSPDGKWIAFDARVKGKGAIYLIPTAGGTPRRLTSGEYEDVLPEWSHDNRWIYFASQRTGSYQIWKMPSAGGAPLQITHQGGFRAQESPNGRTLYYSKGNHNTAIWQVNPNGGEEVQVVSSLVDWHRFAVTSRGIYYIPDTLHSAVMFLSLESHQPARRAALFATEPILDLVAAPHETGLLIAMREVDNSELRILDLPH
jgi:Tol biopolymer transport system component/DNA-binding winged helix-turn-helix (wHTH) protein